MLDDTQATLRRFADPAIRQSAEMDKLIHLAVFGSADERDVARRDRKSVV